MLEITNKTLAKLSKREIFLFNKIFEQILDKKYELSLVICDDKLTDHNVLAYPLSKTEGEILLNPSRKGVFGLPYLFLHACIHLLGHKHGPKMDAAEHKLLHKLKVKKV